MDDDSRVQTLTRCSCLELLATAPVGRVVFTDRALPAVLPVTFVLDHDMVVIRTRSDSRLAHAADNAVLAFEADELEPGLRAGWSVVVTGRAEHIDDPGEQTRLDTLLQPWAPGTRDLFIRIPATLVTGRRITPAPA